MIKMIGVAMVLFSCAGIGFLAGERKKQRIQQLKELKAHLKVLYGEIEYGRTVLPEALRIVASRNKGILTPFFWQLSKELEELPGESFSAIWSQAMEAELSATCLNKKDRQLLGDLGENLGFLDQKMQLSTIGHCLMELEGSIEEAMEEAREKVRLYRLLGVLGGIFIAILMA